MSSFEVECKGARGLDLKLAATSAMTIGPLPPPSIPASSSSSSFYHVFFYIYNIIYYLLKIVGR